MSKTILVTAAESEPLTLSEAKRQCYIRADDDSKDDELADYIAAARQYIEENEGGNVQIVTATYQLKLDGFPRGAGCIELPRPPLQSVDSISYLNGDGDTQSLTEDTDYVVDVAAFPGQIGLAYGKTWPTTRPQLNAVTIQFVAGWTSVPPALKQAMRLLVGHFFENREASSERMTQKIALGVEELIGSIGLVR